LKGHGVVYTATLSSLHLSAKTEADSPVNVIWDTVVVQQVTEWDSIRRQVRKEKGEPKKPAENKAPTLSDVLLRVLAENGHHFSQLGENESLTIILTVHEESPSPAAAKSGTGSTKPDTRLSDAYALLNEAGDLALLGSMHLKQGKYSDAIAVYQKVLSLAKSPNQEADARRMLAMCYVGMGDNEKARAELDKAIDILKKGKELKENPTAAKPAAALPIKLIISAPRKLLNQVKEGKTSFEDFRRQASVETLRFGDRR
jgi:tetratricopeptide (TPR) repeat protein